MKRVWLMLAAGGIAAGLAACSTQSPHGGDAPRLASFGTMHRSPVVARSFLMDLTWVSDQRGWALAATPCANGLCPRVAATSDGGRTWAALPDPPGAIQDGNVNCAKVACVSQIRFATTKVGYLFGPGLYQTADGGHTWHLVKSRPVEALEPSAGTVVRVVYDHGGCPGPCDRTIQETTAGSGSWRTLLRIPFTADLEGVSAELVRPGADVIYLPIYGNLAAGAGTQHAVIYRSTDAGATWQRLNDPCPGTGWDVHAATAVAAAPRGFVSILCEPRSGSGTTFVRTSTDYGSSWSRPRPVPGGARHYLSQLAAPSAGRLVLANGGASGSGPYTYRLVVSADGGRRWSTAVTGSTQINPQAPGASFLGFEDARVGRWISDPQHIWITRDGGLHWLRQAFP